MFKILQCLQGPRLLQYAGTAYEPLAPERWGDSTLTVLRCVTSLAMYTSPLVLPWGYRKGWLTVDGVLFVSKFLTGVGIVVGVALILRTLGRLSNPVYTQFVNVLAKATNSYTPSNKALLEKYDFEFSAWPVDFDVRAILSGDKSKARKFLPSGPSLGKFSETPLNLLSWMLTHSFGLSLVYPGSMSLMQMVVEKPLLEGRTKLIQDYNATRNKVVTVDGNQIDTVFVDRNNKGSNGSTLVICCEGNAGFYEIGMMATPVKSGYSVLGWNHPGFYGSTGKPTPSQEANAADAVMQFAINKLGFLPEQVVVYGWSIGGYTATWLAMNYPDIKGLILDATFDDLIPLAVPRMPAAMSGLVTRAVRNYINLNVGQQLASYSGPVRLIRRTRDEMISTIEGELWSNRGNNLLKGLVTGRYPTLITPSSLASLDTRLYTPGAVVAASLDSEAEQLFCQLTQETGELNADDLSEEQRGRILCYVAGKLMSEVDTTHCTPLPTAKFQLPWDPTVDIEYVKLASGNDQE